MTEGDGPTLLKKQAKQEIRENLENIFENIALERYQRKWGASPGKRDAKRDVSRLKRYVFPEVGSIPIKKLVRSQLVSIIHKAEKLGVLNQAKKVGRIIKRILEYSEVFAQLSPCPPIFLENKVLFFKWINLYI